MELAGSQTKGVGFVNARTFTIARFGEEGWSKVLAALSAPDRAIVAGALPVGWYTSELHARLLRAIERTHGKDDFALSVQIGRFSAEHDLKTIHRIFLRLFSPMVAVEKIGELWPRYQTTGSWVVDGSSPTHLVGRLSKWGGNVDPILCLNIGGYVARCLELAGAKDVVIEHARCGALGDASCDFLARWGGDASPGPRTGGGWMLSPMPSGKLPRSPREGGAPGRPPTVLAPAAVKRRSSM